MEIRVPLAWVRCPDVLNRGGWGDDCNQCNLGRREGGRVVVERWVGLSPVSGVGSGGFGGSDGRYVEQVVCCCCSRGKVLERCAG